MQGAHRIDLSLQRREESIALLTRVISPERVAAEAQAARDLTDLCGQLPLAVRIAAQRLAARPQEQLANLAAQLADEGRRLDALQAGDLQVRAAFGLPQRRLDPSSRRLLRRATMAAGTDFSPQTAALLAGMMLRQAQRCAEELTGRRPRARPRPGPRPSRRAPRYGGREGRAGDGAHTVWEQWEKVFSCAAAAALTAGSSREEAVHLNYLAWIIGGRTRAPTRPHQQDHEGSTPPRHGVTGITLGCCHIQVRCPVLLLKPKKGS
ncbi:hypothetical protein [Streptomyces anulatus]|uniref:hypothetical protein n=1 Tax=Streptomyces anulatus TaxID=1892 RepID=UPI00224EDCFF|nr:hypothetical protein [Streptomyces anulatus]MCX4501608.1 hypothetical protein [Streptomyces anulatus]